MRFGIRKPSLKKRVAARPSWKRTARHRIELKAPRGWGWLTNPKKAVYNRVYNRTTKGCLVLIVPLIGSLLGLLGMLVLGTVGIR
jgi:hypothetical protein